MSASPKQRFIESADKYSKGNLDEYLTYLADDIEEWGPNGMPAKGKEGVAKLYRDTFGNGCAGKTEIKDIEEVMTGDESAYVKAYLQMEKEKYYIKILTIWRKINGQWFMVIDFSSTTKPQGE